MQPPSIPTGRSGKYNEVFYKCQCKGSVRSAQRIVPHVMQLTGCRSVVDVGCGLGTWARAFIEQGLSDVVGVDFHEESGRLVIPPTMFRKMDLHRPIDLGRTFDLAVCLEVGEHLEKEFADVLVDSLVRHGPMILFGAAAPGQGGWSHQNEQWPEYWAARFRARGLVALDCIRPRFWEDAAVDYWYSQNTVLYVRREELERRPALASAAAWPGEPVRAMRHPRRLKCIFTEGVPTLLAAIRAGVAGALRTGAQRLLVRPHRVP